MINLINDSQLLDSLEDMIKAGELICKLTNTDSLEKSCAREACKELIRDQKDKLENIFQKLMKQKIQTEEKKNLNKY